jgi:hypothetical protein
VSMGRTIELGRASTAHPAGIGAAVKRAASFPASVLVGASAPLG